MCLSLYKVGNDNRTGYERLRGRRNRTATAEFGELVHYKKIRDKKSSRGVDASDDWGDGIWGRTSW